MITCGSYHCFVITQDDCIESPFHVTLSPDYRTSSVSGIDFSEWKLNNSGSMSKVPFLENKVTNLETSSVSSLKLSQSTSDISNKENTDETGINVYDLFNYWIF